MVEEDRKSLLRLFNITIWVVPYNGKSSGEVNIRQYPNYVFVCFLCHNHCSQGLLTWLGTRSLLIGLEDRMGFWGLNLGGQSARLAPYTLY